MENKSKFISGSNGTIRQKFIKEYIDKVLKESNNNILIYDATYSLIVYNSNPRVLYFSVDTVQNYLKELSKLINSNKPTTVIADAYAGLMHQKEVVSIFVELLKNKEHDVNVVLSARHKEFISENLYPLFDEKIELDEENTPLANLRY